MPQITFIDHSGVARDVQVEEGHTLMEGARDAGIEAIYADCGGACACATCHVYIDPDWISRVGKKGELEAEMLEFAAAPTNEFSRLSCQVRIEAHHNGMTVTTPGTQG